MYKIGVCNGTMSNCLSWHHAMSSAPWCHNCQLSHLSLTSDHLTKGTRSQDRAPTLWPRGMTPAHLDQSFLPAAINTDRNEKIFSSNFRAERAWSVLVIRLIIVVWYILAHFPQVMLKNYKVFLFHESSGMMTWYDCDMMLDIMTNSRDHWPPAELSNHGHQTCICS